MILYSNLLEYEKLMHGDHIIFHKKNRIVIAILHLFALTNRTFFLKIVSFFLAFHLFFLLRIWKYLFKYS